MSLLADARRKAERQHQQAAGAAAGLRAAFRVAPAVRPRRRIGLLAAGGSVALFLLGGAAWLVWEPQDVLRPVAQDTSEDPDQAKASEVAEAAESANDEDAESSADAEDRGDPVQAPPILLQRPEEPGRLLVRAVGADLPPPVIKREGAAESAAEQDTEPAESGGAKGPLMRGIVVGDGTLEPRFPKSVERTVESDDGGGEGEARAGAEDPDTGTGTFRRERSDGDPKARARTLTEQGQTHRRAGDTRSAMESYRRALELDPAQTEARIGYAELLQQTGRGSRARQVLGEGLAERPEDPRLARRYAALADQAGDLEDAIAALEPARDTDAPGRLEAHLAALYRGTGQYERAAALYVELIEAGDDPSLWRAGLALSLEGQGDAEGARAVWEELADDPAAAEPVVRHARQRLEALGAGAQAGEETE